MTLPKLQGTEKQIAWAEEIRDKRLAEADAVIAKMLAKTQSYSEQKQNEVKRQAACVREMLASRDSAAYWIDTRDCWINDLMMRTDAQLAEQMGWQESATKSWR